MSFRSRLGSQWKTGDVNRLRLRRAGPRGSGLRLWRGVDPHYCYLSCSGRGGHDHGEGTFRSRNIDPNEGFAWLLGKHLDAAGKGVPGSSPSEGLPSSFSSVDKKARSVGLHYVGVGQGNVYWLLANQPHLIAIVLED